MARAASLPVPAAPSPFGQPASPPFGPPAPPPFDPPVPPPFDPPGCPLGRALRSGVGAADGLADA
jgi:hypothetical protein